MAHLEPDSEPSVAIDAGEKGLLVTVDAGLVLGNEPLGLTVGADSRDSTERFLEGGEDGRLGRGVQSLELTRGGKVVAVMRWKDRQLVSEERSVSHDGASTNLRRGDAVNSRLNLLVDEENRNENEEESWCLRCDDRDHAENAGHGAEEAAEDSGEYLVNHVDVAGEAVQNRSERRGFCNNALVSHVAPAKRRSTNRRRASASG